MTEVQTAERYKAELRASAQVILQLCNAVDSSEGSVWDTVADLIAKSHRILVAGMASSMWAAWPTVAAMRLSGIDAELLSVYDLLFGRTQSLREGDLLLLVSQSGETAEIIHLMHELRQSRPIHFPVVAVTNCVSSTLARKADHVVYVGAGEELCAPSKSYFNTVAALGLIWAVAIHPEGGLSRWSRALRSASQCFPAYEERCQNWAGSMCARIDRPGLTSIFHFLALGSQMGSAWQASLVCSETLRVSCCVLDWATFRHGFIPHVTAQTVVIGFEPPDFRRTVWKTTTDEVQNRGGTVILVPSPARCRDFIPSELDTRWRETIVPVFETLPIHWLCISLAERWRMDPSQVRKVTRSL